MRRFFLYLALSGAACAPTVVATQSLTPAPSPAAPTPAAITFEVAPQLELEWQPHPPRGSVMANGDQTLVFTLVFDLDMDVASVASAVRAHLPEASSFRSDDRGRTIVFDVPPGSSDFVIDPRGARSLPQPNVGIVGGDPWIVTRPTTTLSLYRPSEIAAGALGPAESYTFPFAAETGLVRLEPGRRGMLVSIVVPQHLSFVDLPSGRRTPLPDDLNKIGMNGSYMHWLGDGRFLTLGSHETVISGPRGENGRRLPTITPGQAGVLSPDETLVALDSYPTDEVAIQSLASGLIRSVGKEFKRCSAYASAVPSWSPDGRTIAVGYCVEDMEGPGRTAFFDVGTLRLLHTFEGWSVSAWLPNGTFLARSWPDDHDNYMRLPDAAFAVLDSQGRVLRRIESPMPYGISPDGRWLVDGGLDSQHPSLRLVDLTTGRAYVLGFSDSFPTWTPDGLLAVLSRS